MNIRYNHRNGTRRILGALAAVVVALCLLPQPVQAQTKIVALVNNVPITSTEVRERRALVRLTRRKQISERQALDELIDAMLVQQEAKRRMMTVGEEDVDQRYAAVAASTKLGVEKLGKALSQAGSSERAFKADIRTQLLQRKLMAMLTRSATGISEQEIAAGMIAKKSEGEGEAYRYTMQQIVFVTGKDASAGKINQRTREAESLRRRSESCEQAANIAKELRDVAVKPQVVRLTAQLPSSFREQLKTLKVGEATKPDKNEYGVEIIVICSRESTEDDSALRLQVQNELMREQGRDEVEEFVADLRKRAIVIYR